MSYLAAILKDNTGKYSAMRLALVVWTLGVFIVWAVLCIRARELKPLDSSIVSVFATLIAGKVVQKFGEAKPPSPIE